MPSARRIRLITFLAIFASIALILISSSQRHSDARFYDRTVAALNEKRAKAAAALHEGPTREEKADAAPAPAQTVEAATAVAAAPVAAGPEKEPPARQPPEPGADADKGRPGVRKAGDRWGGAGAGDGKGDPPPEREREKSAEEKDVEAELNAILKRSPIIIFSKTHCPFSRAAKAVFARYEIVPAPFVVELDTHPLGAALQAQLGRSTGRRTVPNVLVNGVSIGGGDEVEALHAKDGLVERIRSLAGKRIASIRPA